MLNKIKNILSRPKSDSHEDPLNLTAQQSKPSPGFDNFGLMDELIKAVRAEGYSSPTPIQEASIGHLAAGKDLLGCAQTGTGKTASFALPTLHRLALSRPPGQRKIRTLVLTPTRELAIQVADSYQTYGAYLPLKTGVVFGGVGIVPQKKMLRRGIDILVATPGRLLDLHSQGDIDFRGIEILVLDEADRMLDMGFLPDVKRILKLLPTKRQNILFSATMPKDIEDLSMNLLRDPVRVEVSPVSSTSEQVEQSVFFVNHKNKSRLLIHLLEDEEATRVLVFTRTKAIANRTTKFLVERSISAEAIHGNKSQSARQRALENFKSGKTRVLVASDLAARGIDVDVISHVINYNLPNIAETYVHRIGRSGRAAATGVALSFCDGEERAYLKSIEKLIGKDISIVKDHPFHEDLGADFVPENNKTGRRSSPSPRGENGNPRRGRGRSRRRSGTSRRGDGPGKGQGTSVEGKPKKRRS